MLQYVSSYLLLVLDDGKNRVRNAQMVLKCLIELIYQCLNELIYKLLRDPSCISVIPTTRLICGLFYGVKPCGVKPCRPNKYPGKPPAQNPTTLEVVKKRDCATEGRSGATEGRSGATKGRSDLAIGQWIAKGHKKSNLNIYIYIYIYI